MLQDIFSTAAVFWITILITIVGVSLTAAQRDFSGLPCKNGRAECEAEVREENQKVVYEVSCKCKKKEDVYDFLDYLHDVRCPYVPNDPSSDRVDHAILRIENCNVEKKEFPLKMLQVLRRSKKFTILVHNSILRVSRDKAAEQPSQSVDAKFTNSHITGIGSGWFTSAREVSVQITNCSVGILESGLFSNYSSEAAVDVQLENAEISTIKSYAISLPSNGRWVVTGGSIQQIESLAFEGGRTLIFDAVRIASIQSMAINIMESQTFSMESCLVARLQSGAIYKQGIGNGLSDQEHQTRVSAVTIKGNKFMRLDGDSFSGLCNESTLKFEDNFIYDLESPLRLQSEHCAMKRNWIESVWNNGFVCDMQETECQNFEDNSEQACVLYETSWCLCNEQDLESLSNNDDDNAPCRKPFADNLKMICQALDQDLFSHCKAIVRTDLSIAGRSLYTAAGSSTQYTVHDLFFNIVLVILSTFQNLHYVN